MRRLVLAAIAGRQWDHLRLTLAQHLRRAGDGIMFNCQA